MTKKAAKVSDAKAPAAVETKAPAAETTKVYPRPGSKTEKVLNMLRLKKGATVEQLCKAVDWKWSAFASTFADIRTKCDVSITSEPTRDGSRRYRIS